ncbi:Helix-turn-helix domain-containing protein [Tenacibaculum sp. MAR_2009_124]|uniref:helix-turn-helix domain-containing protein n=1 Tax=Tenacibaculum sp. MAR_2009_124 TaxID=1250059 RepID=UPI00089AB87A|nr:helix-turn-helix domain-containing protein [Tenacibaculum sp. MAR_2009_124]SEC01129.1 Helix-turn-helix domain-containing protein [Tenacibaculum sp. MAR_2009_124]
MNLKRGIYFLFCAMTSIYCIAQTDINNLTLRSYDELMELYENENDQNKSEVYANAFLKKAQNEADTTKILTGFHLKSLIAKNEKRLQFLDSIISLTKYYQDKTYPASAYISKGNFFYKKRDFKKSLDLYLKAKSSAEKTDNPFLVFSSNYSIGRLRNRTNDSIEALNIHRENFDFVKKNLDKFSKITYLRSAHALANAYNNAKVLDSAKYLNTLGIKEALTIKNPRYVNLFYLNEGTTQYYLDNYGVAIENLKKSKAYYDSINHKPNLSESLYFLGKSQLKINKNEEAVSNFKKIDTIFQKTNDLLPRIRDSYQLLIEHYKKSKDLNQQLHYLNRLIKLDSIITSNEIYISKHLVRKYDIPKIVAEKEAVIEALESNNVFSKKIIIATIVILLITLVLLYIQSYKKKVYKERFEAIIKDRKPNSKKAEVIPTKDNLEEKVIKKKELNIPQDIIDRILESLNNFEEENQFLDSQVNIQEMAKKFKTNTNYLSKIINHYKKQNFATYINFLRTDYIILELQTNRTLRNYTISALAREIGFKSSESFSKSFYKRTGIYPSYFISNLEKKNIQKPEIQEL